MSGKLPCGTCVVWEAVGATVLPNLGSWVNAYLTRKEVEGWYKTLEKPKCNPPNWIFGPMWTALYSSMGYASYLVWRDGGGFQGKAMVPLAIYAGHMALNQTWTTTFFVKHNLKGGLIHLMMVTAAAVANEISFYQVNKTAGLLLVPTVLWCSFATYLNYGLYKLNDPEAKSK